MKRLALIVSLAPSAAFAHGGHAPIPEVTHGFAHAGPVLGLVLIALAFGAGWFASRRRN